MVRITIYLLLVAFLFSCRTNEKQIASDNGVMNKDESLAYGMGMLIEFYTKQHKSGPSDAKDLIEYIEKMTSNDQSVYSLEYEFLKRKKGSLVFTNETEVENGERVVIVSVYNKRVTPKNGLYRAYVYFPLETKEQLTE
jgi:hypothetical protein